ncbi:hypothetical protein [Desulfolutivibrio sulfoxidireducens]|uniref:hypothetical protein n=2 Tax=Desulfolutivibrio sulfoxidireducens TaxID=2773299 RepID=UPI00159DDC24|nr:hypothetical protein [Desulfolutivibrio sulfoxidireducens]QLA16968.1 hypothetical protein GD605_13140 [Desulfolutivibrio sulfoxidireducens]QLA20535.1 hypothetical protein GD604_12855 [Desulfolutivibrio sulfoxidireducens]
MSKSMNFIDMALEVGERELASLLAGDIEEAERLAFDRGKLMEEAWRMRESDKASQLHDKLMRLQSLQGQLSSEAKRLHETLKKDLKHAKKENERLSGYRSSGGKPPPVSRFLDKVS